MDGTRSSADRKSGEIFVYAGASTASSSRTFPAAHCPLIRTVAGRSVRQAAESEGVSTSWLERKFATLVRGANFFHA